MDRIKTSDIYYGAYLLSQGGRLEGFRVEEDGFIRKGCFEFSNPRLEILKKEYLSGEAVVNLRSLRSSLKHLKDIILNEPRLTLKERVRPHEHSVR